MLPPRGAAELERRRLCAIQLLGRALPSHAVADRVRAESPLGPSLEADAPTPPPRSTRPEPLRG